MNLTAELLGALATQYQIPSLSVFILGGKGSDTSSLHFTKDELSRSSRDTQMYMIGSITKTVTAALTMRAIEKKLLTLDSLASQYLPSIKPFGDITVRNLLNHTSGLPDIFESSALKNTTGVAFDVDKSAILASLKETPQVAAPNSAYFYSNANYLALAAILEAVKHKSYTALVASMMDELEITDFAPVITEKEVNNSLGHLLISDKPVPLPIAGYRWLEGAGNLAATSRSLGFFYQALFKGKVVSGESLSLMAKEVKASSYGMGLQIEKKPNRRLYHTGHVPGSTAIASWYREKEIVITVLANMDPADVRMCSTIAYLLTVHFDRADA